MSDGEAVEQASTESLFDAPGDTSGAGAIPQQGQWFGRIRSLGSAPDRLFLVVGLAFAVALIGLCSWLGYGVYESRQQQHLSQLLLQVGRQSAVNLTTIDFEHADEDVKRILESASGQFYDEFNTRSGPFIDVVKKMQSKSVGTVTEAGIESVDGDEAQVLVAVSVKTTTRDAPNEQPRYWRMRLTVAKQGADAKVSKVEFVP